MTMFRTIAGAAAFASAALFIPTASADSLLDFTIENQTGYTIKELYLSPSKKTTWGKSIISAPLKDKESRKLSAKSTAKVQAYDLMAVYADGSGKPVWYDLEPAKFSRLTLKWDKAKNKTVAVKHKQ